MRQLFSASVNTGSAWGYFPPDVRREVLALLASQSPFAVSRRSPPDRARYVAILGGTSRRGSGPAFTVDGVPASETDTVELTPGNVHLLGRGFEDAILEIEESQPAYAVVVDGYAVSLCRTVRRSVHRIEAGVD